MACQVQQRKGRAYVRWCLRLIDRVCLECETQPVSTVAQGWCAVRHERTTINSYIRGIFRFKRATQWTIRCLTGAGSLVFVTGQSSLEMNEPLFVVDYWLHGYPPADDVQPNHHSHRQTPLSDPALDPRTFIVANRGCCVSA
jgi:hypothetical protein